MLVMLPATLVASAPASAQRATTAQSQESAASGGAEYGTTDPAITSTVPGTVAQLLPSGYAAAPADAPDKVKAAIWAANTIVGKPYKYGGGHLPSFLDDGYDCSGTISFALAGAGLLRRPRDSRSFFRWGAKGPGEWITVFTNSGHAYVTIAGLRLDTSAADDPGGAKGPRWRPLRESDKGYKVRHPVGL